MNIREQCSWAHTDDREGATEKAIRLVRAGIARTRLTKPLEPIVVETMPKALVIGGGIAGLRAAVGLADVGLAVFLVEREPELGGWVGGFGAMYPHGKDGRELVRALRGGRPPAAGDHGLHERGAGREVGQLRQLPGDDPGRTPIAPETIQVEVGSIVVATGFDSYQPEAGELGYGIDGVVTLPELKRMLDEAEGPLSRDGKPVESIVVRLLRRQPPAGREPVLLAASAAPRPCTPRSRSPTSARDVRQYHLYRDMRTYGKNELMYTESRERGSLYLRFPDDEPPAVERGEDGRLEVTVRDLLTGGEELTIPADLVVLVTGMVPRENEELVRTLKLPIGGTGSSTRSIRSCGRSRPSSTGSASPAPARGRRRRPRASPPASPRSRRAPAILKKGVAELDPLVATVDAGRLHLVRRLRGGVPVRRDRAAGAERQGGRDGRPGRPARAAAAASRSAPRTRSTCRATPTRRCGRRSTACSQAVGA